MEQRAKREEIEKAFVPKEVVPEKKEAQVFTIEKEVNTFAELDISDKLKQILKENNFEKLTNI